MARPKILRAMLRARFASRKKRTSAHAHKDPGRRSYFVSDVTNRPIRHQVCNSWQLLDDIVVDGPWQVPLHLLVGKRNNQLTQGNDSMDFATRTPTALSNVAILLLVLV